MEPGYRSAIRHAIGEKRLWAAGFLAALTFSEAWWALFGWGPEYLGERWRRAVGERMGDAWALLALVAAATAAFVLIRAVGYLGEMVLVRQVADGREKAITPFGHAFSSSRDRYLPFAATLLPWDALRTALVYLPALVIALWRRWDPHLDQVLPYVAVMLLWFAVLAASGFLAGVTATLAARFALLRREGVTEAWRCGWRVLRGNGAACLAAWLQALAAEAVFLAVAWPLSALLPWAAGQIAAPLGFAPAHWLVYTAAWLALAGFVVIAQTLVQVFKSTLWTLTFVVLSGAGEGEKAGGVGEGAGGSAHVPGGGKRAGL